MSLLPQAGRREQVRRGRTAIVRSFYFSDRLWARLVQIPHHPLTVVEAPSGFGKTTAVREYLKGAVRPGARKYWYTCLGEPAAMAWKAICELFSNIDTRTAARFARLGMPTRDTLFHMLPILQDIRCAVETYLVIDNYQLIDCCVLRELLDVFSAHGSPKLHMVFITQELKPRPLFAYNPDILTIDASALTFDKEGAASLFRMEGIRLTGEELVTVLAATEGWVSAICLQIASYVQTGSFDHAATLDRLVETAIWKRFTPTEQDFMLSVSVMDGFTAFQAAFMLGKATLPEKMEEMLRSNGFIRYSPDTGIYRMHSMLRNYLRNQFSHCCPASYRRRILHLAGEACAASAQYYPAAQFFFMVGDFDAILSLPFDGGYLFTQKENRLLDFALALVAECSEETLCRYPFTLLKFAYLMLMEGQPESAQRLCRLIGAAIEGNPAGLSAEGLSRVRGELALLASFKTYNDVRGMSEGRRAALDILGGPSGIITHEIPWTFGNTSVLGMYWREPGKLEDTLRDLDEYLPCYLKLTRGHGAGANSVLRAEVMLMRGEDDVAERLCHRALFDARSRRQTSICLCAELVLARVAILRGDTEGYLSAVESIRSYDRQDADLSVLRMVELCVAVINLALGVTDDVAKWLYDLEGIKSTLYAPAIPYGQILYSYLLLKGRRYNALYGISERIVDAAGSIPCILPQAYHFLFLAVAKRNNGNDAEAQEHLKEALALALPDKIYLPFAQMEGMEDFLSEITENFPGSSLCALKTLCRRQQKGAGAIRKAILRSMSPLTPREREIALLIKGRLNIKEIADKLYISETTARTILRNVYSKLDIHSKAELLAKDF